MYQLISVSNLCPLKLYNSCIIKVVLAKPSVWSGTMANFDSSIFCCLVCELHFSRYQYIRNSIKIVCVYLYIKSGHAISNKMTTQSTPRG